MRNVGSSKVFTNCCSSFGKQHWVGYARVIYSKLSDLLEASLRQSVSFKMVKTYISLDVSKKSEMQLWQKTLTFRTCRLKFVKRLVITFVHGIPHSLQAVWNIGGFKFQSLVPFIVTNWKSSSLFRGSGMYHAVANRYTHFLHFL